MRQPRHQVNTNNYTHTPQSTSGQARHLEALYIIDQLESNYPRDQIYIMRYMASTGASVTAVTPVNSYMNFDSSLNGVRVERKIPIGKVVGPSTAVPIYVPSRKSTVRMVSGRFDLVHSFTLLTWASILGLAGVGAKKILRTEIGPSAPKVNGYASIYGRVASSRILRVLMKLYGREYDYLTAYTSVEAESLRMLGVPWEKVVVLPPMVDFDVFGKLRVEESAGSLTFGCIARLCHVKGVDRVVAPFRELRERGVNFRFVLAGRRDQEPYSHSVLEAFRASLLNDFRYLGEVAPPYPFYRSVDAVVVPSRYETGAIAVLEAMAAGKLVIASDIHPINTYIVDGKNGYLFRNEDDLLTILERITKVGIERHLVDSAVESARKHHYISILERYYKPLFH